MAMMNERERENDWELAQTFSFTASFIVTLLSTVAPSIALFHITSKPD
jgi:putative copper export protein